LEELEQLAQVCAPDVKVLVVGDRTDIEFYRDLIWGLQVTEYLPKPLTRDSVARAFAPTIAGSVNDPVRERGGQVIAVMGARGGVGASTVAVNLAAQLAGLTHGHIAILDLHLQRGTAALMLGAKPSAGLRVALEEPERVDALFLERASVEVGERLRLIATEEGYEHDVAPTADGVARLLTLLRRKFNHIVVDLPMPPIAATRQVLTVARQRVAVLGPDVASIRDTLAIGRICSQLGVPRLVTVLNRAGSPGALKPAMIEEGLGAKPDVSIPDLSRQLPRAANLGALALKESAALRKALEPLTIEVSGVRAASVGSKSSRGAGSWLRRR
jgi:pilus assembly protein CpaE